MVQRKVRGKGQAARSGTKRWCVIGNGSKSCSDYLERYDTADCRRMCTQCKIAEQYDPQTVLYPTVRMRHGVRAGCAAPVRFYCKPRACVKHPSGARRACVRALKLVGNLIGSSTAPVARENGEVPRQVSVKRLWHGM